MNERTHPLICTLRVITRDHLIPIGDVEQHDIPREHIPLHKTSFDKSSRASCPHCLRLHLRSPPLCHPPPRHPHQAQAVPAVPVAHAQAEADATAVAQAACAAE